MEELREPLNLIRDFAHILEEHHGVLSPDEIAHAATAIEEQSEIALQLLDQVATPEAGPQRRLPSEPRPGTNSYDLSARELEVLIQVSRGLADKQIAQALAISTFTVNKHVSSILTKMNAASRTEAGVRAVQENLV